MSVVVAPGECSMPVSRPGVRCRLLAAGVRSPGNVPKGPCSIQGMTGPGRRPGG